MRILIIGAAGMIGRKLVERLAREPTLGTQPIASMRLVDAVAPPSPATARTEVQATVADIADPAVAPELVPPHASGPGSVIVLQAVSANPLQSYCPVPQLGKLGFALSGRCGISPDE